MFFRKSRQNRVILFAQIYNIFNSKFILFYFWESISLYSFGCPGTHYVDQTSLNLTDICLSLTPKSRDKGMYYHGGQ